jgi:uncharacterized protein
MAEIPELVRYIATNIVDDAAAIEITDYEKGRQKIVKLHVSQEDMGRMIGREGRIANAIRSLMRASADDSQWGLDVETEDGE